MDPANSVISPVSFTSLDVKAVSPALPGNSTWKLGDTCWREVKMAEEINKLH